MANMKIGYNFVDYTIEEYATQDTLRVAINLYEYDSITKAYWTADVTDEFITLDLSATPPTLVAVFIDAVNFSQAVIKGKNTNVDWGTPDFTSGTVAISTDPTVDRKKLFFEPSSTFNYRYLRIEPASVDSGDSVFKIGRIVCLDTVYTFLHNPTWDYEKSAPLAIVVNEFKSGGFEVIKQGNHKVAKIEVDFSVPSATESTLWTLSNLDRSQRVILFENEGDTSKAYMCRRMDVISVIYNTYNTRKTSSFSYREVV